MGEGQATAMQQTINNLKLEEIAPVWQDNYVAIALSSSNEYVPYLSVCLESLKEHTSENNNYDIVIFEDSITDYNKDLLKKIIEQKNISLRFTTPPHIFDKSHTYGHVSKETYFKLTIPLIMKKYQKVLFLDSDMIIENDVAELYKTDLGDYALGACICCLWNGLIHLHKELLKYHTEELGIKENGIYIQGGVLLINIPKWIQNNYAEKIISEVCTKVYHCADQGAINYILNGDIKVIDSKWNYETAQKNFSDAISNITDEIKAVWEKARVAPYIIHYSGHYKPWIFPNEDLAYRFWIYARKSVFYEQILYTFINQKDRQSELRLLCYKNYKSIILKYWMYKLLYRITYGNKKEHYRKRRVMYKRKIDTAKELQNSL